MGRRTNTKSQLTSSAAIRMIQIGRVFGENSGECMATLPSDIEPQVSATIPSSASCFLADRVDLQLRLRHLGPVREKCNEVPIFHLCLLETAFRVPRVGYGDLRPRHIIRIGMAIDEGFEQGTRRKIFGFLHGRHGSAKEHSVRVLYIRACYLGLRTQGTLRAALRW
jgi:hypothetical protein